MHTQCRYYLHWHAGSGRKYLHFVGSTVRCPKKKLADPPESTKIDRPVFLYRLFESRILDFEYLLKGNPDFPAPRAAQFFYIDFWPVFFRTSYCTLEAMSCPISSFFMWKCPKLADSWDPPLPDPPFPWWKSTGFHWIPGVFPGRNIGICEIAVWGEIPVWCEITSNSDFTPNRDLTPPPPPPRTRGGGGGGGRGPV